MPTSFRCTVLVLCNDNTFESNLIYHRGSGAMATLKAYSHVDERRSNAANQKTMTAFSSECCRRWSSECASLDGVCMQRQPGFIQSMALSICVRVTVCMFPRVAAACETISWEKITIMHNRYPIHLRKATPRGFTLWLCWSGWWRGEIHFL